MVVLWFALEDIREGRRTPVLPSKPLDPSLLFSNGGVSAEMGAFDRYMEAQLAERQLSSRTFRCGSGDVFIWHSQLYHGGSTIEDDSLSRRSMVAHYWGVEDMPEELCLEVRPGRYLLDPRGVPVARIFTSAYQERGDA